MICDVKSTTKWCTCSICYMDVCCLYVQALQILEHLGILLVSLRCLMMSFQSSWCYEDLSCRVGAIFVKWHGIFLLQTILKNINYWEIYDGRCWNMCLKIDVTSLFPRKFIWKFKIDDGVRTKWLTSTNWMWICIESNRKCASDCSQITMSMDSR